MKAHPFQRFSRPRLEALEDRCCPSTLIVQEGETLFIISQQYGVSWPDIAEANNLAPPYIIYAGQSLIIPGG